MMTLVLCSKFLQEILFLNHHHHLHHNHHLILNNPLVLFFCFHSIVARKLYLPFIKKTNLKKNSKKFNIFDRMYMTDRKKNLNKKSAS